MVCTTPWQRNWSLKMQYASSSISELDMAVIVRQSRMVPPLPQPRCKCNSFKWDNGECARNPARLIDNLQVSCFFMRVGEKKYIMMQNKSIFCWGDIFLAHPVVNRIVLFVKGPLVLKLSS